jgi:hypothetical protein
MSRDATLNEVSVLLRAAGCVFAEEEARLLVSAAGTPADLDALAHLLFGALCEAAMSVADAGDPRSARQEMQRELETLLETIAPRG